MRYVCRVDDCRAFATAPFSFTTEEELVCHWNTFHVAVMPQFTCQDSEPYLLPTQNPWIHTYSTSNGEGKRRLGLGCRCINAIPTRQTRGHWLSSLTPYYKPPGPQYEVPQRLASVIDPPVYRRSRNPGDNVRNIRWAYRTKRR